MKIIRFIIALGLALGLILVLNMRISQIPPLGKFLNPFNGFWQNAETEFQGKEGHLDMAGLQADADVFIDSRLVPHIFAKNAEDAYFIQGYFEAKDRLFQMDFFSRLSSGRLSEVLGPNSLFIDRFFRRMGMRKAAENAYLEMQKDPEMMAALQAYSNGVNHYINQLDYEDYPIEFKLLDYQPKEWEPINSAYLLKLMSFNLTGYDTDLEMSNALNFFGDSLFADIYPDFPDSLDPIIPNGTAFPEDTFNLKIPSGYFPDSVIQIINRIQPNPNNGSNNWAVAGWKSKSGVPMLANDPHLGLHLPSFWYEIQLNTPEWNVYGATLPGAPGVIIGFNEFISWGVTNAQRDVKDWYTIDFSDKSKSYYQYGGKAHKLERVVEEIKVRGGKTFYDTVMYSHHGPVVYDADFGNDSLRRGLALRWMALEPSKELKTFLNLNKARNYNEYLDAISHFQNPGQNFVYAGKDSNIAIWQQGSFPLKWDKQGKFVLDGSDTLHDWAGIIPQGDNPHIVNPKRGFVSSANQHPTDSTYPFYYNGNFEFYRNRRINNVLQIADSGSIDPQYFKDLHNDNKSLYASSMLEVTMPVLDKENWDNEGQKWLNNLRYWDHFYNADSKEPVMFEIFWKNFMDLIMEKSTTNKVKLPEPEQYVIINLAKNQPNHPVFDVDSTSMVESAHDLMVISFGKALKEIKSWEAENGKMLTWANYKNTTFKHWLSVLDAFHIKNVQVGGNRSIVNATSSNHGPSWRMIVSLEDTTRAWVVYPGGQSGNPGSPHYDDFIETWAKGEYYEADFLQGQPKTSTDNFHYLKFNAK